MSHEYPPKYDINAVTLTKDDWQYIEYAVATRIRTASARKGEPDNSTAFKDHASRIQSFLQKMAFSEHPPITRST